MFTSITMFFACLVMLSTLALLIVTIANVVSGYFNIYTHIHAWYMRTFIQHHAIDTYDYTHMLHICTDNAHYTKDTYTSPMYSKYSMNDNHTWHSVYNDDASVVIGYVHVRIQHSAVYNECVHSLNERRTIVAQYKQM